MKANKIFIKALVVAIISYLGTSSVQANETAEIKGKTTFVQRLPTEVIRETLSYLDPKSVTRTACVSRSLKAVSKLDNTATSIEISKYIFDSAEVISYLDRFLKHDAKGPIPNPRIKSIDLGISRYGDAAILEFIAKYFPKIQNLDLSRAKIDNDGLAHLTGLKDLRSLNLSRTAITDTGLVHLGKITSLRALDLSSTEITDTGIAQLRELTNLRSLNLRFANVGNDGLAVISGFPHLRSLNLAFTKITDPGLAHIVKLGKLTSLQLDHAKITDAGISHLASLRQLETLDINGTGVTSGGLASLSGLTRLTSLDLVFTAIDDTGLIHLKGLKNLRELKLSDTKVRELPHLDELKNLEDLTLWATSINSIALTNLEKLKSLKMLVLPYSVYAKFNDLRLTLPGLQAINNNVP